MFTDFHHGKNRSSQRKNIPHRETRGESALPDRVRPLSSLTRMRKWAGVSFSSSLDPLRSEEASSSDDVMILFPAPARSLHSFWMAAVFNFADMTLNFPRRSLLAVVAAAVLAAVQGEMLLLMGGKPSLWLYLFIRLICFMCDGADAWKQLGWN